jgi:valyl-tRNA synthetase
LLESQKGMLSALAGLDPDKLEFLRQKPEKLNSQSPLVSNEIEVYLESGTPAEEGPDREKLQKELAEIESQIKRLTGLLAGPFGQKAPEAVVAAEREKLENYQKSAEKIRPSLG